MKKIQNYQPVNAFTRCPSPAQIGSYLVITLETALFYSMVRPNIISNEASIVLTVLFSVSLGLTVITSFICSYIDPSDSVMIKHKTGKKNEVKIHVSELLYCEYCQTYVTSHSKHCRQCNRCVQNFDHHCMWINNCVGSKNYKPFIIMIASTCFNLSIYIASVVVLSIEKKWEGFLGFIITCWVVLGIVGILWFLLFNLNLLHVYLICKGYTTYQFIVARREQQRQKEYEKVQRQLKEKEEKLKKKLEKQKKRVSEIKQLDEVINNSKFESNNKTKTPKNSIQNDQEESNSHIKIMNANSQQKQTEENLLENNKKQNKKIVGFKQTTSDDIIFDNKSNAKSSDIQSFKNDTVSIKDNYMEERMDGKDQRNLIEVQSESESVRISQFFIRNKSFNFLFSNQKVEKPKKKKYLSLIMDEQNKKNKQSAIVNSSLKVQDVETRVKDQNSSSSATYKIEKPQNKQMANSKQI